MSDDKPKVSDKASEIAKNIWLAGLGAYGKAFDDAQDRLDKATREPPRLFKELVEKGSQIEDEVRDSLSNIRKSSAGSVEERISKVRETLHFNLSRGPELAEINRKLDALTARVDTLAEALAASTKAPPRKATGRGKAASSKKKAAKKSTVRRKSPGSRTR